jgi:hypothetical protein
MDELDNSWNLPRIQDSSEGKNCWPSWGNRPTLLDNSWNLPQIQHSDMVVRGRLQSTSELLTMLRICTKPRAIIKAALAAALRALVDCWFYFKPGWTKHGVVAG